MDVHFIFEFPLKSGKISFEQRSNSINLTVVLLLFHQSHARGGTFTNVVVEAGTIFAGRNFFRSKRKLAIAQFIETGNKVD